MAHARPENGPNAHDGRLGWGPIQPPAAFAPDALCARIGWGPIQVRGQGPLEVARVAAAQCGVITTAQLSAAGIRRGAIEHWVESGRLYRRFKGVYLLGRPTLEPLGAEWAAVLLCGGAGVLDGASALSVWGVLDPTPTPTPTPAPALALALAPTVTVTIVGRDIRSRPGIVVHRSITLTADEIRLCHGLPVTSPARAILAAATTASDDLEQAIATARRKRLLRPGELERTMQRHPGRNGIAHIRAILERGDRYTRSTAERIMLRLARQAGLPEPRTNIRLANLEVDFLWPEERLVVEVDGEEFHGGRSAFQSDRDRDARLVAAGLRVIRITWRQLTQEPMKVIARIAQALARA